MEKEEKMKNKNKEKEEKEGNKKVDDFIKSIKEKKEKKEKEMEQENIKLLFFTKYKYLFTFDPSNRLKLRDENSIIEDYIIKPPPSYLQLKEAASKKYNINIEEMVLFEKMKKK